MYCNEKLKLNKFREVRILQGAEFMQRPEYGASRGAFSEVNEEEPAQRTFANKLDDIAEEFDRIRDEIENEKADE